MEHAHATRDLTNAKVIWLKGGLFLLIGAGSVALLFAETPTLKTAVLLAICIWAFCRAYYFAFYVIERYVDPSYKFAGLISFLRYAMKKRETRR
jgi:hypothetical protein